MSSLRLWFAMILLTVITNTGTSQDPSCLTYKNISDQWRNVGFCNNTFKNNDLNLNEGWYRFVGVSGDQVVSSCARALDNPSGNGTNYNLFTCNSSINYTDYRSCSGGFSVYKLRPTSGTYATRHSACSNSSSICGANAMCGIVYGSCVCKPGFVFQNLSDPGTYGCSVIPAPTGCQTPDCGSKFLDQIDQLLNSTDHPLPPETVKTYLSAIMNITSSVVQVQQNSSDNSQLISYGNSVLAVTDKLLASAVPPTETQDSLNFSLGSMEAEIFAIGKNYNTSLPIPSLNTSNSSLDIDLIEISHNNEGSAAVILVSYTNMADILKPSLFNTTTNKTKSMISDVVSVTLPKISNTTLPKPINLNFTYISDLKPEANISCVYWTGTAWAEDGCKISTQNSSYTVCTCTHLTTFALIMMTDPDKDQTTDDVLDFINTLAVSVGLVFLILTVLTLAVCQRGPKITNAALINLSLSLFFAQLTFLITNQYKDVIKYNQECLVLAGVTHFLFLSAFVWMFIEAVLLYNFVKNLSSICSKQSHVLSWKCMIVIGYVIPLAMVGVTSGLANDCYNVETCWLRKDFTWSFLGPVVCIIGINFLLCCVTFVNLKRALSRLDKSVSHLKYTQTLVLKTLLQFVILGCPWVLGFLVDKSYTIEIVFLVLNSQQGTFIFIVHCVLNEEVRQKYKQWWIALHHFSKYKSMEDDLTKSSHSHSH